ncbi:MAG: efflux RND transporter permease subunit [Planctomycetota bacterium]
MRAFARFAIERLRITWLVIVALAVAGAALYTTHPRQEDPEIQLRSAQVVTEMPGLSPERIEQLITRPLEEQIKSIAEVDEIQSTSLTGRSIVVVEVDPRYDDLDPIWSTLRNKMADFAPRLPDGAGEPRVNDDYGRLAVVTLALTGDDYSMRELHEIAKDLRDELGAIELVATVDLYGVQPERVWLEFDAAFLAQFDLSPSALAEALQAQNIVLPAGVVTANDQDVVIEATGDLGSLDALRTLPIDLGEGRVAYLEDVATIRRGYVEPAQAPAYFNGKPAVVLGVSMVRSSNVVTLGTQLREALPAPRAALPAGMSLDEAIFQPDLVQASVANASSNLMQTMAVVLVVVMLFLGLRMGLIVGAMVPLTMMVTLVGMAVWGIELHRISIAAIIISLGLLVDNGIVIAEEIRRRLDAGEARLDAVLATPQGLAVPLLTSSLTTVLVFMPLMLIDGGSGEFLRSLGQVLILALLSSWFLSISVTPAFCYWFMAAKPNAPKPSQAADPKPPGRWLRAYERLLRFLLRHPFVLIGALLLLLGASFVGFGHVKQRSLGPSERNQFTVYVDLPAGSSIEATDRATQRLVSYLADETANPEVDSTLAYVGSGGPRFFLGLNPNDAQPNKAFLVVTTEQADQIAAVMQRVERYFVEAMPEADGRADVLFLGGAPLGTVELVVTGRDAQTLQRLGTEVQALFHGVPGVRSVRSDWENPTIKLAVEVDQERARRAGVTSRDIANALEAFFTGTRITDFREDESAIPVVIRANPEDRGSLDRLRTVEVTSSETGRPVPLLQVADFGGSVEPSVIRRTDQKRAMTISGKHPDMTSLELYETLLPKLDALALPAGYAVAVDGEIQQSRESNADLFAYAPHALFLIVSLLVLQFNSFRRAAVILLTLPLILIGALFGLLLFGAYFDFTAMLGLFSLAGIIINNGIVLIDRIDLERRTAPSNAEAIVRASLARVRPIVMTTVTTLVGLVPLAVFGGEFWYGLAIVIICGLGVGSVLTLGLVPVLCRLMLGRIPTQPPMRPREATPVRLA